MHILVVTRLAMKVVIQNKTTGTYVGNSGKWTHKLKRAFDFEKTLLAFHYCKDRNLAGADIVIKFENPQCDIPLSFIGASSKEARLIPSGSMLESFTPIRIR